jgi:hypothetical protein
MKAGELSNEAGLSSLCLIVFVCLLCLSVCVYIYLCFVFCKCACVRLRVYVFVYARVCVRVCVRVHESCLVDSNSTFPSRPLCLHIYIFYFVPFRILSFS